MGERIPIYGGPCGFRWPNADGTDVHGCCLAPDHLDPAGQVKHFCSCDEEYP